MRIQFVVCFMMFAAMSGAAAHAAGPQAEDGVLDLRAVSLSASSETVPLGGGWHFHDGIFLAPEQPDLPDPIIMQVPAAWNAGRPQKEGYGYGTYRLTVLLSDRDVGATLGLDIPAIASAYTLYINGREAASAGRIGTAAGRMVPAAKPQTIYFAPDRPHVELLIHVSNFSQRKGGIWKELKLGAAENIGQESRNRILFQTFVAAGLLLIGVFHVIFFAIQVIRIDPSALYFGLACLLLFLRTVFTGDFLAVQLIPAISWEAAVKVEYVSVFWGISCLVLYFHHLYRNNLNPLVSRGLACALTFVTLPVLVLPARIYTEWMLLYALGAIILILYILYGLLRAAWHRRTGAAVNAAIGFLFLAASVNDVLYYNAVLKSSDLVTLGLFLFIFTQMFMLARKYAVAHRETKQLKDELVETNVSLERLVEERTAALSRSNAMLKRAEQARSDLLSDITHELRNPLTSIIGYLRRVVDGSAGHLQLRHMEIAYQKALLLDHVVDDLRQLALLERDEMSYAFRSVPLRTLCETLHHAYDWELLDRRIELKWDVPDKDDVTVCVDLQRMEQVFANLVDNALAHTMAKDRIAITGRYFKNAGACAFIVQDSGTGIEADEQHRIFERFYRGGRHRAAGRSGGTGLGLAIAKTITEAHRGRIGMRSEPGHGSMFYFILPVGRGG